MMLRTARKTSILQEAFAFDWASTLESVVCETEAEEFELASHGGTSEGNQRRSSGSYYTPADVAYHVWDQFFRFQSVTNGDDLRRLIRHVHFVEPSVGSGIFLFTFLHNISKNILQ